MLVFSSSKSSPDAVEVPWVWFLENDYSLTEDLRRDKEYAPMLLTYKIGKAHVNCSRIPVQKQGQFLNCPTVLKPSRACVGSSLTRSESFCLSVVPGGPWLLLWSLISPSESFFFSKKN